MDVLFFCTFLLPRGSPQDPTGSTVFDAFLETHDKALTDPDLAIKDWLSNFDSTSDGLWQEFFSFGSPELRARWQRRFERFVRGPTKK